MDTWLQISTTQIVPVLISIILAGYASYYMYIIEKRRKTEQSRKYRDVRWAPADNKSYQRFEKDDENTYQIEITKHEYYVLRNLLGKIESADVDDIDDETEGDE